MSLFNYRNFFSQNLKLLYTIGYSIIVFSLLRIIYVFRFGGEILNYNHIPEISLALFNGIRFDLLIILYSFLPLLAINLFCFIDNLKLKKIINSFSFFFANIILSLHIIILTIDQQFYTYFQSHLNILVFGFLEDDTTAVLHSMWTDHPIIIITILFIIFFFIQYLILKKIFSKEYSSPTKNKILNIVFSILFIGLYGIGMRGSIGIFPLQVDNATVGDNPFINSLSLNGQFTFKNAIKERATENKITTPSALLQKKKYNSIEQVLADFYGINKKSINTDYKNYIYQKTKQDTFLENNPPNVVFLMMESFGYYYLKFHDKEQLNLLGALEENINEDLFFTNFVSSTRGTIYSLENIVINNPQPIISNSSARFISYKSSIAYPFQQKGYETIFVTGGEIGWRNLFEWIPNQYFDKAYGSHTIKRNNKNAKTNTWGVYDEYLYDDIYKQLATGDKPKMIWALTTSNHTPYELPENYKSLPINISDSLYSEFIADKETAKRNLTAYQYSNNKIGELINKIKNSPLGENTIIALTGDHNSYALFPYRSNAIEEKYRYTVPFYLYIPDKYKNSINYKEFQNRAGSHKDIFPTLINLALSDQEYCNLGNNLLSTEKPDSLFYGINESFILYPENCNKKDIKKRVKAHNTLSKYQILDTKKNK